MVYGAGIEWWDEIWARAIDKFESRLTAEIAGVRGEIQTEVSAARVDILRWSFVFWITQLATIIGALAYLR